MGFFGIGTGEILLILVVALIIWGPGRLPEIARTLGKTVRAFKKASFDLTTAVTREIEQSSEKSEPGETKQNKTKEAPSGTSKPTAPPVDDQPKNPGEASITK